MTENQVAALVALLILSHSTVGVIGYIFGFTSTRRTRIKLERRERVKRIEARGSL